MRPPITHYDPDTVSAILLASPGRWEEADRRIEAAHQANRNESYEETLDLITSRLNRRRST
jgi:hypothetical protein